MSLRQKTASWNIVIAGAANNATVNINFVVEKIITNKSRQN